MAEFKIAIESMWENDGSFELFTNRRPESLPINKVKIKGKSFVLQQFLAVAEVELSLALRRVLSCLYNVGQNPKNS